MYILFGNIFEEVTDKVKDLLINCSYEFIDVGTEEGMQTAQMYNVDCTPYLIYTKDDFSTNINIWQYYTYTEYSTLNKYFNERNGIGGEQVNVNKFLNDVKEFIKKYGTD